MNYLKDLGKKGEAIARKHYESNGYHTLQTNYKTQNGEIDIISTKDNEIAFIEVKTVDHTNDLHEYITAKKINALLRTIDHYLYHYPTSKLIRVDIAFIKDNAILETYENITNN